MGIPLRGNCLFLLTGISDRGIATALTEGQGFAMTNRIVNQKPDGTCYGIIGLSL